MHSTYDDYISVHDGLFDALKAFIQKPNKVTEIYFWQYNVYDAVDDSVRDINRMIKFMDLIKNPVFFDLALTKNQYSATEINILSEYLSRSASINELRLSSCFEVVTSLVDAIKSLASDDTVKEFYCENKSCVGYGSRSYHTRIYKHHARQLCASKFLRARFNKRNKIKHRPN